MRLTTLGSQRSIALTAHKLLLSTGLGMIKGLLLTRGSLSSLMCNVYPSVAVRPGDRCFARAFAQLLSCSAEKELLCCTYENLLFDTVRHT